MDGGALSRLRFVVVVCVCVCVCRAGRCWAELCWLVCCGVLFVSVSDRCPDAS